MIAAAEAEFEAISAKFNVQFINKHRNSGINDNNPNAIKSSLVK